MKSQIKKFASFVSERDFSMDSSSDMEMESNGGVRQKLERVLDKLSEVERDLEEAFGEELKASSRGGSFDHPIFMVMNTLGMLFDDINNLKEEM